MEQLPADTWTHLLRCMDVVTRIKLASCNQAMQQRVYRDCPQAWTTIAIGVAGRNLRDLDLSRLLTRVNAKQVTVTLDLSWCQRIRGTGLAPLQNSRVLETVVLDGTHDPAPALWILRSSVPFNLNEVALKWNNDQHRNVADFMLMLRKEQFTRAQKQDARCICCQEPVAERSRQVVPKERGLPTVYCMECKQNFCGKPSCSMGTFECGSCNHRFCNECKSSSQCLRCRVCFCTGCDVTFACSKCRKVYCEGCTDLFEDLNVCAGCDEHWLCRECGIQSDVCDGAICRFCDDCWEYQKCNGCHRHLCNSCSLVKECAGCLSVFCGQNSFCCESVASCGVCAGNTTFCVTCDNLEHCSGCNTFFCKNHDRLVDCESCGIRHCRACKHVKSRCTICMKACYEGCFCPKPAKRVRIV